ncbi:MAG: Zn-ribbon domain-containing OB-fold protein [Candidatus Rokuibacteriota bacterium]
MTQDAGGPARPVWEGLFELTPAGEPALCGHRCRACGRTGLLSVRICPNCLAEGSTEPVALGPRGVLYSFTVIHQGPKGFRVPYVVGYVDLPEGVRILGHVGGDPARLRGGMSVRLTIDTIGWAEDGARLLGPRFEPTVE